MKCNAPKCEREAKEGRKRCAPCLKVLCDYQSKRRAKLKRAGLCVGTVGRSKCGDPARTGKTMCQKCADAFNRYQQARAKEKKP